MKFSHAYVITGNIGSGKSTVANLLKLYGFSVIDADCIAHQILDENSELIAKQFGSEFIDNGKVHRKKLANLVFNNKEQLALLEAILHPKIKDEIYSQALKKESQHFPYFVDIPLFFEKKNYDFDRAILIYAPKNELIKRITNRDKISIDEAVSRLNLQMDIESKKDLATFVIDNNGDLAHLNKQVDEFLQKLKDNYANLKI